MIKFLIEFIIIVTIFLAFFLLGMYVNSLGYPLPTFIQEKIDNSPKSMVPVYGPDMNEGNIENANALVNSLNDKYLTRVKSIYIGKNRTRMGLDSENCIESYGSNGCGGTNLEGEVVLTWNGAWASGIVLCHELLHDYIPSKSNNGYTKDGDWVYVDDGHALIGDLAQLGVCYG